MRKRILAILFATEVALSVCYGLGGAKHFGRFYTEYEPEKDIPQEARLGKRETPEIYYDNDGTITLQELRQNKYCKITGASDYITSPARALSRGDKGWHKAVVEFVKDKKSKYAFVESIFISEHSNTTYTTTSNSTSDGNTTVTTTPTTRMERKYEHIVYLLRPYTKAEMATWKFGLETRDLRDEEQKTLQRNTGVFVKIAFNKYPAFYAEMQSGDIIIMMNDTAIRNTDELNAFEAAATSGDSIIVRFLRDGIEMATVMNL